ncbi:hypothetical protein [Chryseobacterium gambrini]|uniref:hypothetical protein n=1 Tax=Chryseobacterium gambrini TaxID=373672 RepID=UPI003D10E52F
MKKIIQTLFFFLLLSFNAQKIERDTLSEKFADIEAIIINDTDYEKVDYSFALKKEINSRLKSVNPNVNFEIGVRFDNNLQKKGIIRNVILFLHKTDSQDNLTDLEINFYKMDGLTGKPLEKLNKQQILYAPKNKKRTEVRINVENYHIPFLTEGVLVAVKWLPTKNHDYRVGPAIRFTNYTEKLTYTRYNNDDSKWGFGPNFSRKNGFYTNAMIGLEVYVKKRKSNNE